MCEDPQVRGRGREKGRVCAWRGEVNVREMEREGSMHEGRGREDVFWHAHRRGRGEELEGRWYEVP